MSCRVDVPESIFFFIICPLSTGLCSESALNPAIFVFVPDAPILRNISPAQPQGPEESIKLIHPVPRGGSFDIAIENQALSGVLGGPISMAKTHRNAKIRPFGSGRRENASNIQPTSNPEQDHQIFGEKQHGLG